MTTSTSTRTNPATGARVSRFERLGEIIVRHARLVLVLFVGGVILAGVVGAQVFAALGSAGYNDPGSESAQASQVLAEEFATSEPILVIAVTPPADVDDPDSVAQARTLVTAVEATPGVAEVVSYWTSGSPAALRSEDGSIGQVIVYAQPDASAGERTDVAESVMLKTGDQGNLIVAVSGSEAVGAAINDTITEDLKLAESIAIPITMVVLAIVFGSLVSAGLPLVVAVGSILGSFLVLWLITLVTDVSIFGLNLITGLGLGLGIDYALLMVNRFREERAHGLATDRAVVRTVATAGRTVAVSGVTVAVTLAALLMFPQYFMRTFGFAGISVTLLAVLSAITALPAAMALLGPRTDALRIRRGDLAPSDDGTWARVARAVMRRPVLVALTVSGVLLGIASLALGASFSQVDDRALPADNPATAAASLLRASFPGEEGAPVQVVLSGPAAADPAAVAAHATALSELDGVVRVVAPTEVFIDGHSVGPNPAGAGTTSAAAPNGWARLDVIGSPAPRSTQGSALVEDVRGVPWSGTALVGGAAAEYTDTQAAIANALPWVLAWVIGLTLVVLFLYTGSVVLPIKAVLLNILSLGATIGALVWVFQDGHLSWLVGDHQVTGTLDTSMTVLIAIVAFALSMDYEVFLLSRIKEEHDAGSDTQTAVELGLQRSGRIITAAAVLLAIVFAAFITSGVTPIKQLGFGVAFAILLDATVIRGLLVPAFMRLAGRWNWWAPAPLAKLHRRIGLSEG